MEHQSGREEGVATPCVQVCFQSPADKNSNSSFACELNEPNTKQMVWGQNTTTRFACFAFLS